MRHFRTRSLLVCIFQFAFVLTAITAAQNQYYVSSSGSDSNDGSQAHPWATINHADAALTLGANGTVVNVAPGTYNGNVTTNHSGTANQRIVWLSTTRWGARIVGDGATAAVWVLGFGSGCQGASLTPVCGNYVDVNGFEITGSTATRAGLVNYGTEDHFLNNLVHDVAQGSCGTSNGATAMSVGANSKAQNEWADGNVIFNIPNNNTPPLGCTDVIGLYFANPGGHAYNNIIYNVSEHGMQINHPSASGGTAFSNNTVFHNGFGTSAYSPPVCHGDGMVIADGTNDSINNNISYGNCNYGIRDLTATANNFYKNNLLTANGSGSNQVFCTVGCPTGAVTGTLSRVLPGFVNYNGTPSAPSISGGIVTFPNADFHLQTTNSVNNAGTVLCSALIGNSNCTPRIDIDGNARSQSALALGAYEPRGSLIDAPTGLAAIVQ